jgi:DNA-binding MarR family transcriptional regulator
MATQRLSRLHQRILQWLAADHQRTRGFIVSSHEELVKALQKDKGTISRSLRTLETRGWLVIGRSSGGKAQHLTLTAEGHKRAGEVVKSWH